MRDSFTPHLHIYGFMQKLTSKHVHAKQHCTYLEQYLLNFHGLCMKDVIVSLKVCPTLKHVSFLLQECPGNVEVKIEPTEYTEENAEPAPKKRRVRHPVEKIQEAILAVMRKQMSQRQAAAHFGIPRRTLRDRLSVGKSLIEDARLGNHAMPKANENAMMEYISHMRALGCELNCTEIRLLGSPSCKEQGMSQRQRAYPYLVQAIQGSSATPFEKRGDKSDARQ